MARHYIANQRTEIAVGVVVFALGALLLHDAYDGRGKTQPRFLRPFSFW